MILVYPALFLLGILIAYLVLSLFAGRPLFTGKRSWFRKKRRGGEGSLKTCPVCGSLLEKGQLVKSVAFPAGAKVGNVTERLSHIFGCPFCYPVNDGKPRLCPVCRRVVPAQGYLIARMFERPDRERRHVHVLGCTGCRRG